jgi:DMSO/TMAO reductase YedYZ molybdopterin-dependent catalytic subunit
VEQFSLVQYPEKTALRLLTDRPPQLETPLEYYLQDLTPNEAFYVRWHLSEIPTHIDLDRYRLSLLGHVGRPLSLSLDDLRRDFEPVSMVAVNQCSGNQRSLFEPHLPGAQWINGAVGCARWTGVRLKDLLSAARVRSQAVEVTFQGLDRAPTSTVAPFVKSLTLEHAQDGEVMLAYAMNGAPLPMLNGFPLRLVVPGWYATYWVKALSHIEVLDHPFEGYWMKSAYRIPADPDVNESPQRLACETVPIGPMLVHTFFANIAPGDKIPMGKPYALQGLVTHRGAAVSRVEVSCDDGHNWQPAELDASQGKHAWQRWRLDWTPSQPGPVGLRVRATLESGETQAEHQWNRSGYARNAIERVAVEVI